MTKALKEIMKAQGISATRIARTIGRSPRLVSERIRSKNTTLDNLRELLVVLDYRIVIMPNGVRLPDGVMRYEIWICEVSTVGQAKDGNSLEAQEALLSGCDKVYKDSFTGFSRHRPALDELMSVLREGDTLVVTKLDRIARSTQEGLSLVNELIERGVNVDVLNMGLMDNSPNGKLIRTIFFAFAEFERDMIVSRTREGKDIARLKEGYKEGRPFKEVSFKEYYSKWLRGEKTVSECCSILGISRGTWYNRVKLS